VARVEDEIDLFQVFGYSPLRVREGCRLFPPQWRQ
jgi:hypothetical protein